MYIEFEIKVEKGTGACAEHERIYENVAITLRGEEDSVSKVVEKLKELKDSPWGKE